jgi:2-octaprenyl-6-methoxyphenol hydroxylase
MQSADIVIVGGGLVGAVLAKALSHLGLRLILVEKNFLTEDFATTSVLDTRALALNIGSLTILQKLLGVDFSALGTLVQTIYVSDQQGFGRVTLRAQDENLAYFGCVIPILQLTRQLQQLVLDDPKITCVPGTCVGIEQHEDGVTIKLADQDLTASLVLGADGAHSKVREFLDVASETKDYNQTALIGNVRLKGLVPNIAYERFTREGPLALLPLDQEHMTLVWVMPTTVAELRQKLPMPILLADLQKIMGYRAGAFVALGALQAYPLQQVIATKVYQGRVGLVGNAAHSLHPVAAQGFNLSMRDIFGLYQIVKRYSDQLSQPEIIWQEYVRLRTHDQQRTAWVTDTLLKLFAPKNFMIRGLRNSLLLNLELVPQAKSALNEVMVGFA